jgi:hypothetical protein
MAIRLLDRRDTLGCHDHERRRGLVVEKGSNGCARVEYDPVRSPASRKLDEDVPRIAVLTPFDVDERRLSRITIRGQLRPLDSGGSPVHEAPRLALMSTLPSS